MKRFIIPATAVLAAAWGAGALAQAQTPGPPAEAGKTIALTTCAYCHVVAPDQAKPPVLKEPTPSFQQMADNPHTTAQSLRAFMANTHWEDFSLPMTMPRQILSPAETDAVIAYVLSLRGRR